MGYPETRAIPLALSTCGHYRVVASMDYGAATFALRSIRYNAVDFDDRGVWNNCGANADR